MPSLHHEETQYLHVIKQNITNGMLQLLKARAEMFEDVQKSFQEHRDENKAAQDMQASLLRLIENFYPPALDLFRQNAALTNWKHILKELELTS